MSDFKKAVEKLSGKKKEQLGDSRNSTEYIMKEIYSDEELLDEELNMVSGGTAVPDAPRRPDETGK